ncbi:MAG: hypothetical protein HY000_41735 [Planctomycetes bacterium]|nr:hypothetical protein [Planctomycetota bacterium]
MVPPGLLTRWRELLSTIENEQIDPLLVNKDIFAQLNDCIKPHVGTRTGADLASWMAQCYVAFVGTAIRRLAERLSRYPSVSLRILLEELLSNASCLTFQWYESHYDNPDVARRFAQQHFDQLAGCANCTSFPVRTIQADIDELERVTAGVKTLTDKFIAHTDLRRHTVTLPTYADLDKAVDVIWELFSKYRQLLTGAPPAEALLDDVRPDLKKIWP